MLEIYVLDIHVLVWYFIGSRRLKSPLLEKIDQVRNKGGRLLIPTIVLSEALDITFFHESGLMTKDRIIQESGEVETL